MEKYHHGQIIWRDLTVPNTEEVKSFYEKVVGWETSNHDMGDYHDYNVLIASTKEIISGIIHKKGVNEDLPPVWLLYVYVDDVSVALDEAIKLGGEIIIPMRKMGTADFAVLKDPAGAVFALIH